jgi:hypothetical protein
MTKLELGPVGVTVAPAEGDAFLDAMAELEELGFSAIWLAGGPLERLSRIRAGADQVVLSVLQQGPPGTLPVEQLRQLAGARIA